jgi:hypothetical protein
MRRDAKIYLGEADYDTVPLSKIYHKLRKNKEFRRRRLTKAYRKDKLKT